ncbi:MAG: lactate utilization protein [Dehalococcoidales bacterium]|nr:MAG: lactate utilization protein [Dehalococcoidales bacterium]
MDKDLPILILEPELTEKRDSSARKLLEGGQKTAHTPETVSIDDTKRQIRTVREYARNNLDLFVAKLKTNLKQKYPHVKVKSARDNTEAIEYISGISDGLNFVSINNSGIVAQELRPELTAAGFTVVNSYLNEFDARERSILDYWDLPRLSDRNLVGTFKVSIKTAGLDPARDTKKYLAVLGVNAISAEDGTVFFLEHFSNIHNDLRQAEKVILAVGLDKIVRDRQDATFQTKCMGIFGMESALLGIGPKSGETLSLYELGLPPSDRTRELHVIILDNGRSNLLQGKYEDLFLCIGCRACNQHCPIQHSFTNVDYIWTPRNYLNQFLYGRSHSIDVCLHCEACRLECPLDIDLPHLMWQLKMDYVYKRGPSFYHRILGRPELLARLGTPFAPLANRLMGNGLIRGFMEIITGIDRKSTLPKFHYQTFRKWFRQNA